MKKHEYCDKCQQSQLFKNHLYSVDFGAQHICADCIDSIVFQRCGVCGEYHNIESSDIYVTFDNDIDSPYKTHFICQDCIDENDLNYCEDCDLIHSYSNGNYFESLDKFLCLDCEVNYSRCESCENLFNSSDVIEDGNGDCICEECQDNYCICESCDTWQHIDYTFFAHDSSYCEYCFNEYFSYCYYCDEVFRHNELYHNEDEGFSYCEYCADSEGMPFYSNGVMLNRLIQTYGFKPHTLFYNLKTENTQLFSGFELEIENIENKIHNEDMAEIIKNIFPSDFIYFKEDSSINNGFEIVSQPFTFSWFKAHKNKFTEMLKEIEDNGFGCEINCGMHIHLSRCAFQSNSNFYKFMKLHYENYDFIYKISERNKDELIEYLKKRNPYIEDEGFDSICSWGIIAESKNQKELLRDTRNPYGDEHNERYTMINLLNGSTIENRIFQGTTNIKNFSKNIEFCYATFDYVKNDGLMKINPLRFMDYVKKNQKEYPNLNNFMQSNCKNFK